MKSIDKKIQKVKALQAEVNHRSEVNQAEIDHRTEVEQQAEALIAECRFKEAMELLDTLSGSEEIREKGEPELSKQYFNAKEIAEIMDCSERFGYKIIQELNVELKAKGYIIRSGRIPRKYFFERTGLTDQKEGAG